MTDELNSTLIRKAVSGDEIAINKILAIFEPLINTLVTEPLYDKAGNEYIGVNVDLQDYLRDKVIQAIRTYKIA